MIGHIAALYRHPVKGFTPERLDHADLTLGGPFPCDRLYAVENGPSGFDAAAPGHISKQKFTVLAAIPEVAKARTAYDEATHTLRATAPGQPDFTGAMSDAAGQTAFAGWLGGLLGEEAQGPLRVIQATGHRFMDHPLGHVSIINLATVRDLEARIGKPVDPLRFRGNVYVEGWPAWVENDWAGRELMVGFARVKVFKPIVRCAATHVDPTTAERDMDVVKALFDNYGHMNLGIYVHVADGGRLTVGDACTEPEPAA
ncbi:MAG: MOSC N-terminal beta barrel domain-containing protein [Phenylobacterium sp.]|uniref:MOSC domain-containing protein n=1 Tax=Phenylobacterium sp. TaxID=1871053 RepID=UPI0027325D50|nr:MOSC N-terminal beta barrel domain-containing protein [Phenylobacterium sp.]MDP3746156.1 MOSC N-terminal beta barrel domain-containing protein [Phenylobacterium sp.]